MQLPIIGLFFFFVENYGHIELFYMIYLFKFMLGLVIILQASNRLMTIVQIPDHYSK